MAMVYKKDGKFVLSGNKHKDQTLDEVAEEDPGYLTWLWNSEDMLGEMTSEAQDALEDVMNENGISFDKPKGRRR